jgi:hypothetical protein
MDHSNSWQANRLSASQEIPHILWNRKVHYRIHNSPPPFPILSQLDPVHVTPPHFLKIHLNINFPSKPGPSKLSPSLRFLHQNPVYTSPTSHTCYLPRPSHLLYLIIRIKFSEEYRSASIYPLNKYIVFLFITRGYLNLTLKEKVFKSCFMVCIFWEA